MKKNKTGKPEKNQLDLFSLPEVNSANISARMSGAKNISTAPISSAEHPIKPLSKPTHKDNGE
ncbi:MAG: hypothetical protein COB33_012355 [Thiotrichaceae bacterium]|nr:hypothetical protein [Thiotrichaceae bacterium]